MENEALKVERDTMANKNENLERQVSFEQQQSSSHNNNTQDNLKKVNIPENVEISKNNFVKAKQNVPNNHMEIIKSNVVNENQIKLQSYIEKDNFAKGQSCVPNDDLLIVQQNVPRSMTSSQMLINDQVYRRRIAPRDAAEQIRTNSYDKISRKNVISPANQESENRESNQISYRKPIEIGRSNTVRIKRPINEKTNNSSASIEQTKDESKTYTMKQSSIFLERESLKIEEENSISKKKTIGNSYLNKKSNENKVDSGRSQSRLQNKLVGKKESTNVIKTPINHDLNKSSDEPPNQIKVQNIPLYENLTPNVTPKTTIIPTIQNIRSPIKITNIKNPTAATVSNSSRLYEKNIKIPNTVTTTESVYK